MKDPFPTTHWSDIRILDSRDAKAQAAALSRLYEAYWPPLYAFLRRRGEGPDRAEDLLQGFFVHLLDHQVIARLDLSGKLRAFLLASLKNYVHSEHDRETAKKRRPQAPLLNLDLRYAEQEFARIASPDRSPDEVFARRWAATVVQRAVERLRDGERLAGRSKDFELVRGHVMGGERAEPYRRIAAQLGVSESAVKVRVHRLRKRLGQLLREDIAATIGQEGSVDDEVRQLLRSVA